MSKEFRPLFLGFLAVVCLAAMPALGAPVIGVDGNVHALANPAWSGPAAPYAAATNVASRPLAAKPGKPQGQRLACCAITPGAAPSTSSTIACGGPSPTEACLAHIRAVGPKTVVNGRKDVHAPANPAWSGLALASSANTSIKLDLEREAE